MSGARVIARAVLVERKQEKKTKAAHRVHEHQVGDLEDDAFIHILLQGGGYRYRELGEKRPIGK